MTARLTSAGYCGKIPQQGDFVARGLPSGVRRRVEDWLAAGLSAARETLGDGFDDAWHVAPLWRFAARPGRIADGMVIGVVGPSVDAVGRRFPLCVLAVVEGDGAPVPALGAARAFLDAAETFFLRALDPDADLEAPFAALTAAATMGEAPPPGADDQSGDARLEPLDVTAAGDAAERLDTGLELAPEPAEAWATLGGPDAPARGFAVSGRPDPAAVFSALLAAAQADAPAPAPGFAADDPMFDGIADIGGAPE